VRAATLCQSLLGALIAMSNVVTARCCPSILRRKKVCARNAAQISIAQPGSGSMGRWVTGIGSSTHNHRPLLWRSIATIKMRHSDGFKTLNAHLGRLHLGARHSKLRIPRLLIPILHMSSLTTLTSRQLAMWNLSTEKIHAVLSLLMGSSNSQ